MMLALSVLDVIVFAILLVVAGVMPRMGKLSRFELERRKASGDGIAAAALAREERLSDILSLQRVLSALLLVVCVLLSVVAFGWFLGIIVSVVVALEYGRIARAGMLQRRSQKLYDNHEQSLLHFVQKFEGILRIMRTTTQDMDSAVRLSSREELHHLVQTSGSLLSPDEKVLISHSLTFDNRLVSEIMTPRGVIDSINSRELLGPLVLDDLHKTGHSRFPVVEGDIDHVVGMLHIRDLLSLDIKRSVTAGKAMEPRVFYIREDQTLKHALAAFLRTHHHLFVVVNEFRETVGLLSLEDVIEALIGHKIVDEFDAHDDLRVVAARNPQGNNSPKKHEDI
jgi:CBS domain containing-hemolysin-like protein